jgi:hypothetical protein
MRKVISWLTMTLKDLVGEDHWTDPVWSKVISNGIVVSITFIFTSIIAASGYLIIYLYSFIRQVPAEGIITQIGALLKKESGLPNWVVALLFIFFISSIITFTYRRRPNNSLKKHLRAAYSVNITSKFLVGRWINQWTNGGTIGTEEVEITDDMKYFKDGVYCFNIEDFEHSVKTNKIFFIKSSIRPMDFGKRFRDNLFILNNNLISGTEDGYEIKYKRFYFPEKINFDFMVGHWRNQWTDKTGTDFEICQITPNKEYYTRGELFFNLKDFKYDPSAHTITFSKVPSQPNDTRKESAVTLTIKDNDLLVGKEGNSDVVFTREF